MRQHRIISLDICSYIPLAEVNVGLLADDVGIAATNTLDLRQGVLNLALAINVRVEQTCLLYTSDAAGGQAPAAVR